MRCWNVLIFGVTILHDEELSIEIHGDQKMKEIECYPNSRQRRKQGGVVCEIPSKAWIHNKKSETNR